MTEGDEERVEVAAELSRREAIRLAAGLAGAAAALAACGGQFDVRPPPTLPGMTPSATVSKPGATATPAKVPSATLPGAPAPTWSPEPPLSPSPEPSLVPSPEPTATPIALGPLFDETALARAYVAYDAEVQGYPAVPPFDPEEAYPEYPYAADGLESLNGCYRLVREALRLFAPEGYGTPEWSPLASLVKSGDRVLVKPNLVDDSAWKLGQITHPAFLRPILDYAVKACGPNGQVILGEGPWAAGVFDRVVENTGIRDMVDHLVHVHGAPVVLLDLNKAARESTPLVDLGSASALALEQRTWLDAHARPMEVGGDPGVGRYRISPAVLGAEAVISVPKVKVHCSGGVTLSMKNMLGIIPAWDGPYEKAELKDCAHSSDVDAAQGLRGIYLNNDTIWRSMADLNRILLYADATGQLQPVRQRTYLAIVDGIVAAEESQYEPTPHPLGTVVIGTDPVTCDALAARAMGFDPRRLRSVVCPEQVAGYPLGRWRAAELRAVTSWGGGMNQVYRAALTPELRVFSWQGQVEADDWEPPDAKALAWSPATGELRVHVTDPAGVAYVRLAFEYAGRRCVLALSLAAGDAQSGEWVLGFPAGAVVRGGELAVGDELYNEAVVAVGW